MPDSFNKPCREPGCHTLTQGAYCAIHQAEHDKSRRMVAPEGDRGTSTQRGYGVNWRRLRAMILAQEPLCRVCRLSGKLTPAQCVDHVVPLSAGGSNRMENLQPLCHSCHSRKTAREDGGYGRSKREHDTAYAGEQ